MSTVVKVQESKILDILQHFDPALLGHWNPMRKALWASFWGGDFESHAKGKFVEHYDMVRRLVPEERLLEYRVGEGWERLCGFLETPVPEEEFPVTNERNTFGDRIQVMVVMAVGRAAKRVLPVLGGIVAVGVAAWMYGR